MFTNQIEIRYFKVFSHAKLQCVGIASFDHPAVTLLASLYSRVVLGKIIGVILPCCRSVPVPRAIPSYLGRTLCRRRWYRQKSKNRQPPKKKHCHIAIPPQKYRQKRRYRLPKKGKKYLHISVAPIRYRHHIAVPSKRYRQVGVPSKGYREQARVKCVRCLNVSRS